MPVATSSLPGRPLLYELMPADMNAAEAFYRTVVGWTSAPFEGSPQPYTMFKGSDPQGAAFALHARKGGSGVC